VSSSLFFGYTVRRVTILIFEHVYLENYGEVLPKFLLT